MSRADPLTMARKSCPTRRFHLLRIEDPSGVSGVGIVADGVQFRDGTVALHWPGPHASTAIWSSIADVRAVHGHGGKTRIVWVE